MNLGFYPNPSRNKNLLCLCISPLIISDLSMLTAISDFFILGMYNSEIFLISLVQGYPLVGL